MKYEVKKIWKGFASVRDYAIKECISKKEDLIIFHNEEIMTVPFKKLLKPLQLNPNTFGKFGRRPYKLYEFYWIPDNLKVEQINQNKLF